jgi:hypothetical protein
VSTPAKQANPWKLLDISRTDQYAETAQQAADEHDLIEIEYRGTDEYKQPCTKDGCGGTMHYRATVGALQCPTCRTLARVGGRPIRGE